MYEIINDRDILPYTMFSKNYSLLKRDTRFVVKLHKILLRAVDLTIKVVVFPQFILNKIDFV